MNEKPQSEQSDETQLQDSQTEEIETAEPLAAAEVTVDTDIEVPEGEIEIETISSEQRRIEELEIQLSEAKDQTLRSLAEVENTRKRANREVVTARKSALKGFARQLMPVTDNFDRTLDAIANLNESEAEQPLVVGLRLSLQEFTNTLKEAGIRAFNPKGETFDPEVHEAITMFPTADAEPNTVVEVIRVGYFLNDELLRAAQVIVAQSPPTE